MSISGDEFHALEKELLGVARVGPRQGFARTVLSRMSHPICRLANLSLLDRQERISQRQSSSRSVYFFGTVS